MKAVFVTAMAMTAVACNKFIDVPIDNRVGIDELGDLEKAIVLLEPGSDHHFTDLMTDDYTYKLSAGHTVRDIEERLRPIYTFAITKESISRNQFLSSGMNPSVAFQRYYFRLNNANLLIDRALKLKASKQENSELKRLDNVIAHAMTIRAYCHFMVVNLFAKQYDKNSASTDLAVPYISEYNANAVVTRPRQTVQYIYDGVEADLLEALRLIDDGNNYFKNNFYFSKLAIYAFLNRFYLNTKNYSEAIKYADLVLEANNNLLNIREIKADADNNHEQYSKNYFDPSNKAYLFMGNNTYQLIAYFWHGLYIDPLVAEMKSNSEAIQTSPLVVDMIPIKLLYFSSTANRNFNLPLFTVDEVVYNKLEATILRDQAVSEATKAELNRLVSSHFTTGVAIANRDIAAQINALSTPADAIKLLLRLKRIRFHAEGMRWFDIKRHNLPVTHDYVGTSFKISGSDPAEYVIKLPLEEINFNNEIN